MSRDESVIIMGEDITDYGGAFGVTRDLHERFPGRVLATPISENGFTGVAVGAAMTGLRPIVEIMFMDFITLAMDQILNHAAKVHYMYGGQASCPLVIRTASGGYRGYGVSHSQTLEACFMSMPGIKIVAPSTPADAYATLLSAVEDDNPVLFIEHKLLYNMEEEMDPDTEPVPIGKARVVREGKDITLATHSYGVAIAGTAVEELEREGIDVELIDLRTLKPMDCGTIVDSVKKTGAFVYLEEGNVFGGVGAEVASLVVEEALPYIDGRILRVGRPDVHIPASLKAERMVLPDVEDVVRAVKRALSWR